MFSATTSGRPSSIELADQVEIALEVARVDDDDDDVRRRGVGRRPRRTSIATCSSGERLIRLYVPGRSMTSIQRRSAVRQLAAAGLFFDGDAGIVRDFLAQAGEGVEDRGLAAVGIAGQRDGEACRVGGDAVGRVDHSRRTSTLVKRET